MTKRAAPDKAEIVRIAKAIEEGDRRTLARAITLVESSRDDQRDAAERLITRLLPRTRKSIRIGISGAPGVGKSTFIEAFGLMLTGLGHRVAVLAVDPSSSRSGGSILGDKTRMPELSREENAYIRPSPAGATTGGVARRTREAMLLVEAAGFDVVIVETVGVGQSETAVCDMVDLFLLLMAPGGGDELQGIKRGVMELADLVVVNKADGDLLKVAGQAAAAYKSALHLLRPKSPEWTPKVLLVSAIEKTNIEDVWQEIERFRAAKAEAGTLKAERARQARAWMWNEVDEGLRLRLRGHPRVKERVEDIEREVMEGKLAAGAAARELLSVFLGGGPPE